MLVSARLGCAAAVAAVLACVTARAEVTSLVSRPFAAPNAYGGEGDGPSTLRAGALSGDRRWLVFASEASNLVAGDTNGSEDVFLRDNASGALVRIAPGKEPVISGDSAWIAFSTSVPLVAADRNQFDDVYVVNRDTLAFELVSIAPIGVAADGPSTSPSISADGSRVAFESRGTVFGVVDTNGLVDVYMRNRTTASTMRISNGETMESDGDSVDPAISGDGQFVAFESDATNLDTTVVAEGFRDVDIFRYHIVTGATRLVSHGFNGVLASDSSGASYDAVISDDGRFVAFESLATNLTTAPDTNFDHDVYRRDMTAPGATLVSVGAMTGEAGASGGAFDAAISGDGQFVAFRSSQVDLVSGETNFGMQVYRRKLSDPPMTLRIDPTANPDAPAAAVAISFDGVVVAFASEANNLTGPSEAFPFDLDVFVTTSIDAAAPDTVVRASANTGPVIATGANAKSFDAALSGDGRYVVFSSLASNLVGRDRNAVEDVFRHDTATFATVRVSAGEGEFSARSDQGVVSADGRYVAFRAYARIAAADENSVPDVYLRDMQAATGSEFTLVSVASGGAAAAGPGAKGITPLMGSGEPAVAAGGRIVAFASDLPTIVAGDTNGRRDVFVRDLDAGVSTRVNVDGGGRQSSAPASLPALSGNGRVVAFESAANDLDPACATGVGFVFVHDPAALPKTRCISVAPNGAAADGPSGNASLSFDGRYVAFDSTAGNLVPDDTGRRDVFVHDRTTRVTTRVSVDTFGNAANGDSFAPRISGDGRFVVFESTATSFGGAASGLHTFVHDRLRGATGFLDADASVFGNRDSSAPAISPDGTRYAITSSATNWTAAAAGYRTGDTNIWSGATPRTTLLSIDSDAPDPSPAGAAVTVLYTLAASSGTPTGLVTFSATTGESCTVPAGAAACPLIFPGGGVRAISAYYSGNLLNFPARSAAETHTVEGAGQSTGFTGETPLVAADGDAGDQAGSSVASSEEFVVVGAPNGGAGEGQVYVFQRVTNAPPPVSAKAVAGLVAAKDLQPVATLSNPNGAAGLGDKWGGAVAISPDGATIVIGAPGAGGGNGAAAMFARPGATWTNDSTPDASLVPSGGVGVGDKFGTAVAVGAGNMIAVGAPAAASGGGSDAGAAHVFVGATPLGSPLTPNPATADANTNFGQSLAMSGGRLVIGAPNEGAGENGAVRLYDVTATSVSAPTVLAPTGGAAPGDKWGTSVAIDGTTVVGGAPGASGGNGAGVVFQDTGSGMSQRGRLDGGPAAAAGATGTAVAVAGDYIMLGAPLADVDGRADQGRAFVFIQPEAGWQDATAVGSLSSADGGPGDGYGSALALTRRGAIVGIPNRDVGLDGDQGQADSFILDRIFRGAFE